MVMGCSYLSECGSGCLMETFNGGRVDEGCVHLRCMWCNAGRRQTSRGLSKLDLVMFRSDNSNERTSLLGKGLLVAHQYWLSVAHPGNGGMRHRNLVTKIYFYGAHSRCATEMLTFCGAPVTVRHRNISVAHPAAVRHRKTGHAPQNTSTCIHKFVQLYKYTGFIQIYRIYTDIQDLYRYNRNNNITDTLLCYHIT